MENKQQILRNELKLFPYLHRTQELEEQALFKVALKTHHSKRNHNYNNILRIRIKYFENKNY